MDFGLTQREAKVYYVLSRLGSASANEASVAAQFNRLQTYRAVKGLLDRGLVELSLERPRRYTPLKIEHAINLLEQEAENRIAQLESKKPLLLSKWSELSDLPVSRRGFAFRFIQGSKNVFRFAMMLSDLAEQSVDLMIKDRQLMRWVIEGADDSLQRTARKKVTVRGISQLNQRNLEGYRRFLAFCDFRHVADSEFAPLILVDGKEVLVCLTDEHSFGLPESAMWTNHPDLVAMLENFFNTLWACSQDGKMMVEKINQEVHKGNSN